jgi:hypothetical protein
MCPPAGVGTVGPVMPTISRIGVEVRDAGRSELPQVRRVLLGAYRKYPEVLPPAVFCRHTAEFMTAAAAVYERLGFRRDLDPDQHTRSAP